LNPKKKKGRETNMQRLDDNERAETREKAIYRYVEALDKAEFDTIAEVLDLAANDPELSQAITEVNFAIQEEMQLTPLAGDAEIVRALIRNHLHSATDVVEDKDLPLTVGEVAAKLKSERRVPFTDDKVNNLLLNSQKSLPAFLSLEATRLIGRELGVKASDRYWRAFRDAAITLSMGRGRESQLLAAREQREHRSPLGARRRPPHSSRNSDSEE
jgi:hypothetical protein